MKKIDVFLARLVTWRNFFIVSLIYILIIWVPYFIIEIISPPKEPRHWWIYITHLMFACVITVPVLCQLKIAFRITHRKIERKLDIFLTVLIWIAFTALIATMIPILFFLALLYPLEKRYWIPGLIIDAFIYLLSRAVVFVLGIRLEIEGAIPTGTYVIVFNHESSMDYFIWPTCLGFKRSKIVAGTNLRKFPIVGQFFEVKCLMVDRKKLSSRGTIIEKAEECIKRNINIALAPEGGRKRRNESGLLRDIRRWKNGAFDIATETNVSIIPVLIIGSGDYKPPMKGTREYQWYNSARVVRCIILPQINSLDKSSKELKQEVYEAMLYAKSSIKANM